MPGGVGALVPLVVAHQLQRVTGLVVAELVRAGRQRVPGVGVRVLGLGLRDRADRRERTPVRHVRERPCHLDRDVVATDRDAVAVTLWVGVGPLVLVAVQEVVVRVRRAVGEGVTVERGQDAELHVLRCDRAAVLILDAVTQRESPLGEVVVGRAQVGGQVGHQHHLLGLCVIDVLRQRPHHQVGQDGRSVDVVRLGRVHRRQAGDRHDVDVATSHRTLDLGNRDRCVGVLTLSGATAFDE